MSFLLNPTDFIGLFTVWFRVFVRFAGWGFPASSWFLLRQMREKRATVRSLSSSAMDE